MLKLKNSEASFKTNNERRKVNERNHSNEIVRNRRKT